MLRIATWNVNSVKARLPNVMEWLDQAKPDVTLLQEIKCQDDGFPLMEFESAGWNVAVHGQKSYNGVAILSRHPMENIQRRLPGDESDEQARYIQADIQGLRIASLYLPNGNPTPGDKFDYKLRWMRRLVNHAKTLLAQDLPFVLGGDYNICPTDADVYDPAGWANDALCRPESRALFRELCHLGLTEAFRALHPEPGRYSFWDYQAGAWPRDNGLRIDHFLLSPGAADRLTACDIDKAPRGKEKASDHTPVWIELQ
ncbi:exodeoxyribonuclease III [Magnetospirillum sp. 64-120]|uniref:exodeoxyribonuclease III n=1 Tax=Magnetospirillum sp. 64-120 TaxID=1895778 RepID=UPI000A74C8B6|nr:exodeoxyribonuclease III [Magnetospirillum sp. 64-120]